MRCPVCKDPELKMADRQGIEIDYCPQCRGVWLDRGELDKIIERSAQAEERPAPAASVRSDWEARRHDHRHDDDDRRHGKDYRKRGLLGQLFDFD